MLSILDGSGNVGLSILLGPSSSSSSVCRSAWNVVVLVEVTWLAQCVDTADEWELNVRGCGWEGAPVRPG